MLSIVYRTSGSPERPQDSNLRRLNSTRDGLRGRYPQLLDPLTLDLQTIEKRVAKGFGASQTLQHLIITVLLCEFE
jgi:hypothetical protein